MLILLSLVAANTRPLYEYNTPLNSTFIEACIHGYIPVDDNSSNDLFYWYFNSRSDPSNNPLIVWFAGGPGSSSSNAILSELGPFYANSTGQLVTNPYSWNSNANILFIDNPIGTGLSHGAFDDLAQTENDVAVAMVNFFTTWISLPPFQSLAGRDIYIAGVSYGGHYVPYIANALRKLNNPKIKIVGASIGNGLINSADQFPSYTTYAMANQNLTNVTSDLIKKYTPIFNLCSKMMKQAPKTISDRTYTYCWKQISDFTTLPNGQPRFNMYDIRYNNCTSPACFDFSILTNYMNQPLILKQLSSDKVWIGNDEQISEVLSRLDFILNCGPQVQQLLDSGVKVLTYYGDQDWICNWMGGNDWSNNLKWKGQSEYQKTTWQDYLGGIGQVRQYKNFQMVRFFNAGHLVSMDKPQEALTMINNFISSST